jgi:hypothetical protein
MHERAGYSIPRRIVVTLRELTGDRWFPQFARDVPDTGC